jgi:hypothetical protein
VSIKQIPAYEIKNSKLVFGTIYHEPRTTTAK